MYFVDALTYPFKGNRAFAAVVIFAILLLIPVIGLIIYMGYSLRMVPLIYQGNDDKPDFDFGRDFGRGIVLFAGAILYYLIPIALSLLLFIIFGDSGMYYVGSILLVPVNIFFGAGFAIGAVRYALEDDTGALFDVINNFMRALSNTGALLMYFVNAILFVIIGYIIVAIGFILLFCPGLFALTGIFLFGSMYLATRYGIDVGLRMKAPPQQPQGYQGYGA